MLLEGGVVALENNVSVQWIVVCANTARSKQGLGGAHLEEEMCQKNMYRKPNFR